MKGLLLGLLFATSNSPTDLSVVSHATDWKLNGEAANNCVLASFGDVHDARGAQLTVHCDGDEAVAGNVVLKLPAALLQHRRLSIVAEVEHDERMTPTLWIKSTHNNLNLQFESDVEESMFTAASAGSHHEMTSVVAGGADAISVGIMLHGSGAVAVKNFRVKVSDEGAVAPQAQVVLDTALTIIRQHVSRGDIDWNLLNAQAQRCAAGASESADVYPVIRYVLQQLGDKRSMVLSPATAQILDTHRSSESSSVSIVRLPDGADLVLNKSTLIDQRIADRWP